MPAFSAKEATPPHKTKRFFNPNHPLPGTRNGCEEPHKSTEDYKQNSHTQRKAEEQSDSEDSPDTTTNNSLPPETAFLPPHTSSNLLNARFFSDAFVFAGLRSEGGWGTARVSCITRFGEVMLSAEAVH